MAAANNQQQSNPLLTDDVRRYLASLKGGYRAFSPEKRSLLGKMYAAQQWATRRARYGPTGRRPRSYKAWRQEHDMPAIGEDGKEIANENNTTQSKQ